MNLGRLLQQINTHFDLEEIRTLSFILGEDFDNLRGETKEGKARELISKMCSKERLGDLVAELQRRRPNVTWETPPAKSETLSPSHNVTAIDSPDDSPENTAAFAKQLDRIHEQLEWRRMLLFIGADFPAAETGLPSRQELADLLAGRQGLVQGSPLSAVAQQVMGGSNRFEFTDFLRQSLDTTGRSPAPIHRAIVRLVTKYNIATIVTTTYDEMLELAFQEAGAGLSVVVRDSDIHYTAPDRPALIRLYGHIRQPDTLVVTGQDQNTLLRGRSKQPLVDEIQSAFRRNGVLYLGHDLNDPTVAALVDELTGENSPRSYAIWTGLGEGEKEFYGRQRNVEVIAAGALEFLEQLLAL